VTHGLFAKHGISSTYWLYKGPIGSHLVADHDYFPLWGEWVNGPNELDATGGEFRLKAEVRESAEKNRFAPLAERYYWKDGKPVRLSPMDNGPVLESLRAYWKE
jgi:hypothetical protein